MYLGLPHPSPSVLEFSHLLDGLFPVRLSCFVSRRYHLWDSKSLATRSDVLQGDFPKEDLLLTPTGLGHDDLFTRVLMALECFVFRQEFSISKAWGSAPRLGV